MNAIQQAISKFLTDVKYPSDLTVRDIEKRRKELCETLKPQTINGHISHLRSMYTWGMKENIVKSNPFFKIKNLPEVERDYVRSLTSTEVKALLEASKGHYRMRWALYLYTGLRAENGNDITLDNIDMEKRIIHFPATMMKNSKAMDLPIHDKLYEILEEYIEKEQPEHFLFPRRSLVAIRLKLKTDLKTAGINQDGITLHALRHTFASSLL
jgi:integrase